MVLSNEDLSQPISVLLKKGTAHAHEMAEHSQGAIYLAKGQLDKLEYVRFLMMLWQIYSTMEASLDKHQNEPVLKPTYNPHIFARAESLSMDIAYLLGQSDWQHHSLWLEMINSPPQPLSTFLNRLRTLSLSSDTTYLLLAHAYTRYLGDLSGGQFIRRTLSKAYDLPSTGEGVRFYMFSNGGEAIGPNEVKQLKDWYRDGMNLGVGDDEVKKEALVEEAILSFGLNQDLFTTIKTPEIADQGLPASKNSAATQDTTFRPFSCKSWLHSITIEKLKQIFPLGSITLILIFITFGATRYIPSTTRQILSF